MQVSVESISNLERRLTIQVPAERVDNEVASRLKTLAGRVRIDGFRPGKVPFKVVKDRYAKSVYQEVLGEVMQSSFYEAVAKEKLRLAGQPLIDPVNIEAGQPLEYTATFEVYPEFELSNLDSVELKVPAVEIQEADIDRMLENLQKQRQTWEPVEREAEDGDQVVMDFAGKVDGVEFEGGSGKAMPVVIGQGRMIDGFEEQLKGIKAGDARVINVTFPDEYPSDAVKGRAAQFEITATAVNRPALPDINEEFAKLFGVDDGSVAQLRADVKDNMTRELHAAVKNIVKNQVMDALLEKHQTEVPKALLADEVSRLRQQAMGAAGQSDATQFPDEMFADNAGRRVKLGLIIGEVIRKNSIKLDPERVTKALQDLATGYEDPQMVFDYYRKSREQMQTVEALVLEEQVVDWVKSQVTLTDDSKTFEELMLKR